MSVDFVGRVLSAPTLDVLTCVQQPRAFRALHASLPVYVLSSLACVLFLSALPGELLCSLDITCSLRRISHFLVRFSGLAHCGHVVLTFPFSLCSSWLHGPDCINFLFLGTQSSIYGTSWALTQSVPIENRWMKEPVSCKLWSDSCECRITGLEP